MSNIAAITEKQIVDQIIKSIETDISKDLIRAILWHESKWRQYDKKGKVYRVGDDIGIAQLSSRRTNIYPFVDMQLAARNTRYNVQSGVRILEAKLEWVRDMKRNKKRWSNMIEKYNLEGQSDLDIAIRAYNGLTSSKAYLWAIKETLHERKWER